MKEGSTAQIFAQQMTAALAERKAVFDEWRQVDGSRPEFRLNQHMSAYVTDNGRFGLCGDDISPEAAIELANWILEVYGVVGTEEKE